MTTTRTRAPGLELSLLWLLLAACGHAKPAATTNGPDAVQVSMQERAVPPPSQLSETPTDATGLELHAGLLAPLPVAITSFGATSDGTHLYVAGGYHGEPHRYSHEGQARTVQRLAMDGQSGWETIGEIPEGAQGLHLVHHGGQICRFGGSVARNASGETMDMHSSTTAACLNLTDRTWQALPDIPVGLSSHGAALVGSRIYLVGGWTLSGEPRTGTWNTQMRVLDLGAPDAGWQAVEMPFQRRAIGAAAVGNHVVVVGGMGQDRETSRSVDIYDVQAGSWSSGPEYPEDAFGIALAGLPDGTVVGSARGGNVYSWKPGQATWQPAGHLAFGRFFHQMIPTGPGRLVAIGGIGSMHSASRTRHVERVTLGASQARVLAWSMGHAGQAKNRQAAFVIGDDLYLFGGNNSLGQHDFDQSNFVAEGVRIHLPSMQTSRVMDFPARRQSMVVVRDGARVYALGGFGYAQGGATTQQEVYSFDRKAATWAQVGQLPLGRTQFGAFAHAGKLWVIGGLHYDPALEGEAAFDHRTDILSGSPDTLAALTTGIPAVRRAFAGAAHGGSYYMVGGMRAGFALVAACLSFQPDSGAFAGMPCPGAARLSGSLIPLADKLWLVGGTVQTDDGLKPSNRIEVFLPDGRQWKPLAAEVPFSTRHAHVLRYRNQLLVVSTHNDEGRIRFALIDGEPEFQAPQAATQPKVASATAGGAR